ncbi:MAG: hypothetical protein WAO07_10520, partial [Desulfobacterales bacterium]
MSFNDLLAKRESQAGSLIFTICVEPLEHHEDPLVKLGRYADPVVFHEKMADMVTLPATDFNTWFWAFIISNGVYDKILEKALDLGRVNGQVRQLGAGNVRIFFLNDRLKIIKDVFNETVEIRFHERRAFGIY